MWANIILVGPPKWRDWLINIPFTMADIWNIVSKNYQRDGGQREHPNNIQYILFNHVFFFSTFLLGVRVGEDMRNLWTIIIVRKKRGEEAGERNVE